MNEDAPLILLVDDEAHIVYVVGLKLQESGYRVMTAQDGREALKLAVEHRPDLVITDYQMPYLTGVELCQQLRINPATQCVPALILSARSFSLPKELGDTNVRGIIAKPFSSREILSRVHNLLGGDTKQRVNDVA